MYAKQAVSLREWTLAQMGRGSKFVHAVLILALFVRRSWSDGEAMPP